MRAFSNDELKLAANTIRGLAIDAIQAANSGHPGLPLGMADVAACLWLRHIVIDPTRPDWPDRDRFVLSGGHGSALLYSLLHLAGYNLPMEELRKFRQLGSLTPGHPEYGHTSGVDATTGPLGQGIANAVGMALAERMLAGRLNSEEFEAVDHFTYCFCGDGDMMEGISHEACSFAGHLKLERLVLIYDSNGITIEGSTGVAHTENVRDRFEAYGWRVLTADGHDFDSIDKALSKARRPKGAPTLIICKTVIGKGSPNLAGTAKVHGEPLGAAELALTKRELGIQEEAFNVPQEVYGMFADRMGSGKRVANKWYRALGKRRADAEFARLWDAHFSGELPEDIATRMPAFAKPVATRAASGSVIQALAAAIPSFVGGSADLAPSNKTWIEGGGEVAPGSYAGRNIHFGVRELGMGGILNGIALHGGLRAFGSTFFVFSDYVKPTLRIAALSRLPVIYVFTHDSFYVGEDGPTHEPVEQIASLRSIPNMTLIRPADATETAEAWIAALRNTTGPTALLLTRQNLPVIQRGDAIPASLVARGAYTLVQTNPGTPDVILIATGSEVNLAVEAAKLLAAEFNIRVVSMPSWEIFEAQPEEYRDEVLPPACPKRVSIEAASPYGWEKYVGEGGISIAMNGFGASGPYASLEKFFGFTPEAVANRVREMMD